MTRPKVPSHLVHPHAPEPLPHLASAAELLDLLGRAQIVSLLEPRSSNGRADHPAHQLMGTLEELRRELPLAVERRAEVTAQLDGLFKRLGKAGYFAFARIITHRQPRGTGPRGILGVLTVSAAHPQQELDGVMQW